MLSSDQEVGWLRHRPGKCPWQEGPRGGGRAEELHSDPASPGLASQRIWAEPDSLSPSVAGEETGSLFLGNQQDLLSSEGTQEVAAGIPGGGEWSCPGWAGVLGWGPRAGPPKAGFLPSQWRLLCWQSRLRGGLQAQVRRNTGDPTGPWVQAFNTSSAQRESWDRG